MNRAYLRYDQYITLLIIEIFHLMTSLRNSSEANREEIFLVVERYLENLMICKEKYKECMTNLQISKQIPQQN